MSRVINLILDKVADQDEFFNIVQKWDTEFGKESQLQDAVLFVLTGCAPDNPPAWFELWRMSVPDDLSTLDRSVLAASIMFIDVEMKDKQQHKVMVKSLLCRLLSSKNEK